MRITGADLARFVADPTTAEKSLSQPAERTLAGGFLKEQLQEHLALFRAL